MALLGPSGVAWAAPVDPLDACAVTAAAEPLVQESWRCFYLDARRRGTWDEATQRLRVAMAAQPENGHIALNLAHLHGDRGMAESQALYVQARALYDAADDPTGRVQSRIGQANNLAHRGGEDTEIVALLDTALDIARASGDGVLIATAQAQYARHLWRTSSDYLRAYQLLRQAETTAFPDGPYQLRLVVLHVLAGVCRETGRLKEGADASARMAELAAVEGDRYVEATARLNLAQFALRNPGQLPEGAGLEHARKGRALAVEVGSVYAMAAAECTLAEALGAVPGAEEHWDACIAHYASAGEPMSEGYATSGKAAWMAGHDAVGALALAERAVAASADRGMGLAEVEARFVAAAIGWETDSVADATVRSEAHLAALARVRDRQSTASLQADIVSQNSDGHHFLASRLNDHGPGFHEQALTVVEQLRARELSWELETAGLQAAADPIGDAALAALGEQISALQAAPPDDPVARLAWSRSLEALELEEGAAREAARRRVRAVAELLDTTPAGVSAVQGALEPGELLISYQLPPQQHLFRLRPAKPWALAISRFDVWAFPLPSRAHLDTAVPVFAGLARRGDSTAAVAAPSLYSQLLAPAIDAFGQPPVSSQPGAIPLRRLILVADGPLHGLPFGALRETADAPPVAERFAVQLAPSATTWVRLRTRERAIAVGPSRVFADPPIPGGHSLPRLPWARREARAVAEVLPGAVVVSTGELATEVALRRSQRPPLLHLAAHAVISPEHPERTAVLLGPTDASHDGLLQVREIGDLDLSGSVVLLSACRGAEGRVRDGDGVQGLTRAFLAAGADAVVASLWPLADDEAARTFTAIARELGQGASPDEAVRLVSASARGAGAPSRAWAGLQVHGEGSRPVFSAPARGCSVVGGGGPGWPALPLALVCFLWPRVRRRRMH